MNQNQHAKTEAQLRIAKRVTMVIGALVALIFAVVAVFAVISFQTRQPVRDYFEQGANPAPTDLPPDEGGATAAPKHSDGH